LLLFSILPVRITSIHIPTSLNNFGLDREWLFIFNYSNILVVLSSFKDITKNLFSFSSTPLSANLLHPPMLFFYCYFTPSIFPQKIANLGQFISSQSRPILAFKQIISKFLFPPCPFWESFAPPLQFIYTPPLSRLLMCLLGANDGAQIFLI